MPRIPGHLTLVPHMLHPYEKSRPFTGKSGISNVKIAYHPGSIAPGFQPAL